MEVLREYVGALARQGYALAIGAIGALATVVGIFAPGVLQRIGATLVFIGFIAAQFMAWREMRDRRVKAGEELVEAERRWRGREAALLAELEVREKRKQSESPLAISSSRVKRFETGSSAVDSRSATSVTRSATACAPSPGIKMT